MARAAGNRGALSSILAADVPAARGSSPIHSGIARLSSRQNIHQSVGDDT